jgi:predicted RNase H-like nuclease (RuvC/YqgF family)
MTLLSEALAERKQLLTDIRDLSDRWKNASVRYEDDEAKDENPDDLEDKLSDKITDFRKLSVRINQTNNATTVTFDGDTMSVMEAVAYRESLLLRAKAYRATADHAQTIVRGRSRYGATRTKDDIRQIAATDIVAIRKTADDLSETVRRLDSALQQKNWTTELV